MGTVNKEIFKAITQTRQELAWAHTYGTKQEQLDIFKRLQNLYASLNVEIELETTKEIEIQIKKAG